MLGLSAICHPLTMHIWVDPKMTFSSDVLQVHQAKTCIALLAHRVTYLPPMLRNPDEFEATGCTSRHCPKSLPHRIYLVSYKSYTLKLIRRFSGGKYATGAHRLRTRALERRATATRLPGSPDPCQTSPNAYRKVRSPKKIRIGFPELQDRFLRLGSCRWSTWGAWLCCDVRLDIRAES